MTLSILDQVAPFTRLHIGIAYRRVEDGKYIQLFQLLNRDDRSVLDIELVDGQATVSTFRGERRFAPHVSYFCELAERFVSVPA